MGCGNSLMQTSPNREKKQVSLPPWMQDIYIDKELPSLLQTKDSLEFDFNPIEAVFCENIQIPLWSRLPKASGNQTRKSSATTQQVSLYEISVDQSVQWTPDGKEGSYSQSFHPIQTALDNTISTIIQDNE